MLETNMQMDLSVPKYWILLQNKEHMQLQANINKLPLQFDKYVFLPTWKLPRCVMHALRVI
jgi:hypothetical protein